MTGSWITPPQRVLLVEDDPGDVFLVQELLAEVDPALEVVPVASVAEAVSDDLLRGSDCVLLDLNLPGLDGRAVLRRVKSTPELARIPVVVLSSSSAYMDVRNSYDQRANCYVVKPTDFETFERTIRHLVDFWAGLVHLPDD